MGDALRSLDPLPHVPQRSCLKRSKDTGRVKQVMGNSCAVSVALTTSDSYNALAIGGQVSLRGPVSAGVACLPSGQTASHDWRCRASTPMLDSEKRNRQLSSRRLETSGTSDPNINVRIPSAEDRSTTESYKRVTPPRVWGGDETEGYSGARRAILQ